MTKISLRAYLQDIDTLIEQKQFEEAIGHCRHILKIFPKHIDTYRLLGKSFLEAQRYTDAADVFHRVLSSVPDDFLAHVGMSMIREDEGNQDLAIWHMERAFEVQPSNAAIQDELRRLYGKRDGIEPPKIRLTRGALARMYLHGNLPQQAIAELRTALAKETSRPDLQVVLAQAYFQLDQKVKTAEVSSSLLSNMPYCLEANRILSKILPGTDREEDAKVYQKRLQALDPYEAYLSPSAPTAGQVPDAAVSLEKLEWHPGVIEQDKSSGEPDWASSLGVQFQDEHVEQQPEWLTDTPADDQQPIDFTETDQPTPEGDEIPEWMRESGWESRDGLLEEAPAAEGLDQQTEAAELSADEPIAQAEIPDWLQEMAPPETEIAEQAPAEDGLALDDQGDLPSWLGDTAPGATSTIATFLEGKEAVETPLSNEQNEPVEEMPDWMKDLGAPESASPDLEPSIEEQSLEPNAEALPAMESSDESNALPDWLQDSGQNEEHPQEQSESLPAASAQDDQTIPDWLKELEHPDTVSETSLSASDEMPEWLKNLEQQESQPPSTPETESVAEAAIPAASITEEVPERETPAAPVEVPSANLEEGDLDMAWLESLAAKQGADEETLLTKPEDRVEQAPEWVQQAAVEPKPAAETSQADIPEISEEPAVTEELPVESAEVLPATPEEGDLDMAWLESLAAKQGADEETLLTKPEDRVEQAPEWVQQAAVEPEPAMEIPQTENPEASMEPAMPEESTIEPAAFADQPDLSDGDAAMAWLESLAAKQGADEETLLTKPEDRLEQAPEWVQQAADDELAPSVEQEAAETPELPVVESSENLSEPAWLDETEPQKPAVIESEEEAPEWLPGEVEIAETPEQSAVVDEKTELEVEETTKGTSPFVEPIAIVDDEAPDWLQTSLPEEEAQPVMESNDRISEKPEKVEIPIEETPAEQEVVTTLDQAFAPEEGITQPEDEYAWVPPVVAEEIHPESEKPVVETLPTPPVAPSTPPADKYAAWYASSRQALQNGDIESTVKEFARLIKKKRYLDEIIDDIQEAVAYRYPVDVSLWQTLGDAYSRADRLQDALDAYSKAEDLLR